MAVDPEYHRAASTFAVRSLNSLDSVISSGFDGLGAKRLSAAFSELLDRLPLTYEVDVRNAMSRANQLLSDGEYAAARDLCAPLLSEAKYGTNAQIEVRRMMLEALIGLRDWGGSRREADNFVDQVGRDPIYRATVEFTLHNAGLALGAFVALGLLEAEVLLVHIMAQPCFVAVVRDAEGEYRSKFDALRLLVATMHGSQAEIGRLTSIVHEAMVMDQAIAKKRWLENVLRDGPRARRRAV